MPTYLTFYNLSTATTQFYHYILKATTYNKWVWLCLNMFTILGHDLIVVDLGEYNCPVLD